MEGGLGDDGGFWGGGGEGLTRLGEVVRMVMFHCHGPPRISKPVDGAWEGNVALSSVAHFY